MRSGRLLVLVAAVVAGVLVGALLFSQLGPIPLPPDLLAAGPGNPNLSPSASAGTSPPSSSLFSPSASRTPTPRQSSAPPFTKLALLQPADFLARGWGAALVDGTWDDFPPDQITSCTEIEAKDAHRVAAYAAVYRKKSTTGTEIVVRYANEATARTVMATVIERIAACAEQPTGDPDLAVNALAAPDPAGVSEIHLWRTTGVAGSTARGVVAIVRAGDRIALLTMISLTTDPIVDTEYASLALAAGRRLV